MEPVFVIQFFLFSYSFKLGVISAVVPCLSPKWAAQRAFKITNTWVKYDA